MDEAQSYYVYRLRNFDDELLYVGTSKHPNLRLKEHRTGQGLWGHEIASMSTEVYYSLNEALAAEKAAIQEESPRYNYAHNPVKPSHLIEPDEEIMTSEEVAQHLGISSQSVQTTMRRAGVPVKRGYLRRDVVKMQRAGQGHRSDLRKEP